MRWLILLLLWPQMAAAQTIPETMAAIVDALPDDPPDVPDEAQEMIIALLDPNFTVTHVATSPLAMTASAALVPAGQRRWKWARAEGARLLVARYDPYQVAAVMLSQSYYGQRCTSLQDASRTLLGQDVNDADTRALLTLVTLTQAPAYFNTAPDRLTIAFERNVNTLKADGMLSMDDANRLRRLGPAPLVADVTCAD